MVGNTRLKAVSEQTAPEPGSAVHLALQTNQTRVYRNGWIATEARA